MDVVTQNKFLERLDRIAVGLERLAEDPVVQFETHIPECPHCRIVNPVVLVKEEESAGRLSEIVIIGICQNCHEQLIAIPLQLQCVRTIEEARELLQEISAMTQERAEENGSHQG